MLNTHLHFEGTPVEESTDRHAGDNRRKGTRSNEPGNAANDAQRGHDLSWGVINLHAAQSVSSIESIFKTHELTAIFSSCRL